MIKSHYKIAHKVIVFVEGNELSSPQMLNEVRAVTSSQYNGRFSEIVIIGEDNNSIVLQGR